MKTTLFILFLSFFFLGKSNNGNKRDAIPVVIINDYLRNVSVLTQKIAQMNNADSVRFYAKKLMVLSDKMEERVLLFSNYKSPTLDIVPIILVYPIVSVNYALVNTSYGPPPAARHLVNEIFDCASRIRFLYAKNPSRIQKNLGRINEIKEDLQLLL